MDASISWIAVLLAGVAQVALGSVWFSPAVFGTMWMNSLGMTPETMEKMKKRSMAGVYLTAFVATLVTAYVLAHFARYAGAVSFTDGMQAGFWAWLGFVAPIQFGDVLWEGKPMKCWIIGMAYYLVSLALAGGILVAW